MSHKSVCFISEVGGLVIGVTFISNGFSIGGSWWRGVIIILTSRFSGWVARASGVCYYCSMRRISCYCFGG